MKNGERSWVSLLDLLTEGRKCLVHLRVIDTIVFDNLNSLRPLFWIYTNEEGIVQKRNLREWTITEILDNILHVLKRNQNTKIIKILDTGERAIIESLKYETIITKSLKAIQVFNGPYCLNLDMIVHDYTVDEEKVYYSDQGHVRLIEMTNPINHRVKAMTGLILYYLNKNSAFKFERIQLFYYADQQFSDPWLAGFGETCLKQEPSPKRTEIKSFSKSYSKFPAKDSQEWRSFSKGTPIVRGRQIANYSEFSKANITFERFTKLEQPEKFDKSMNPDNFESEMKKTVHPTLDSNPPFPTDPSLYSLPCHGHFCKLESIKLPKSDPDLRCQVPFYLIEVGQRSTNSPYINPDLRKIPIKIKQSFPKSQKFLNRRILFQKQATVCLKCFVVYNNIKAKKIFN